MTKRNNFRRALKQLKSVEIEEKLNGLNEAPTNSMGGVYNLNPKGWHNDPPKPAKTFYPDKDGNWPDGFPANAGDKSYTRPAGWWDNENDWIDVELANTKVDSIGTDGKSTEGIIDEDGYVKTALPPGTRDFILGPLIDGFTYLHGYDAYTSIGYIQKDTRAFVLLGYIDGQWSEGFHHTSSSVDVWDGTESGFTSYNDKFTLEHALWFRDQVLKNKYTYNVPYFKNGGTPQQRPWPPAGGWPDWIPEPLRDLLDNMFGGACPGVGNGDSADEEDLAQPSGEGGHGPDEGEPWVPPGPYEKGDSEDAGFWGPLFDKAKERLKDWGDKIGDSADNVRDFLRDLGGDAVETGRDLADSLREVIKNTGEKVERGYEKTRQWTKDNNPFDNTKPKGSLDKYTDSQRNEIQKFRNKGDMDGEVNYRTKIELARLKNLDEKGELKWHEKAGYKTLQVLHNISNFLDPIADHAEKMTNILGPLAGGAKGKVATNIIAKGFQMAAAQVTGKATTTFALPSDNGAQYNLQHAGALLVSILSGQPQEVKMTPKLKNIALGEIDLNKVKDIIQIGSHTKVGSEKTIRPNNKGDIFNDGSPFGIIGGYEFTVNPEDGTYQITGQKMLRTDGNNLVQTAGSDEWVHPNDAKGKITRFQDIPEIEDKDLTPLVNKLINEPGIVRTAIEKGAQFGDKITGQEGTDISVYDQIKNNPEALDALKEEISEKLNASQAGSRASDGVQGTASNAVYVRKILTKLGFPKSQAEQEGKGYGQVYTTIKGNVSDLSPELQQIIKSKQNVKESSLERWERILVKEIASAPAAPAPSPAPQSDAPTDRKSVTDGIAKDYLEKNGLDKTKQLLDKTEEFLAQEGEIAVGKAEEIDWNNPDEVQKYFESTGGSGKAVEDHTILKIILTLTKAGKIFNSIDGLLRGFNNWYNQGSTAWERTAKWGFRDTFEKLFKGQKVDGDTLWGRAWDLRQKSSADASDFAPWRLLWTWAKDKGGWLSGPDPGTREMIRRFPTEMKQIFNTLKDVGNKYWIHDPINEMDSKELMDEVLYNIPEDWLIPNYDKAIDKHPQMSRLSDQSEPYYDELDLLRNLMSNRGGYSDDPEIRQAYIDHNSAQWGGYTDWDKDSPTYNTWIEDPDSLYHLDKQQRFERVGVSYSQYQKHIDVAGRSSDGEIANFNQILDGQPGLTGLAGKAVEAGNKVREIEKRLPGGTGWYQTDDKEEYDGWVKAQNEHGPAMTAYMKAFDAWDAEISKAGDMSELVSDKISQIRKDYETKYDDLLDKWHKKTEEHNNRIEEIYMELDKITRKMEPYWEEIDRQIAIEYGEFKVAGWYEEIEKMYDDLKGKPMSPGLPKGRDGMDDRWDPEKDGPPVHLPVHKALGVGDATTAATVAGHNRNRKRRGNHRAHMASYRPKGEVLRESIKFSDKQIKLLKEIKKPVEVKEEPIQKLRKYRPNFKGRYSPQNTPNVTASKQSDELVTSGNAKGQTWRTKDKNWSRYETQERMNVVFDKVGHGNIAWDMIVNENQRKNSWKNREIQEQLNIIAAEKGERKLYPDYESPWGMVIHEQETIDADNDPIVKVKDPLFKSVAKRLRKDTDYKDKPSSKGYPNDPPPKMVDGWHPKLGQRYKYDKLDPVSAKAMPLQGNPEIDANIKKARQQPKIEPGQEPKKVPIPPQSPKVKKEQYSNWRSEEKIRKGLTNA